MNAWFRRTVLLLRRSARGFLDDHCQQMAAAISFHLLFSLFPLAIAAVGVIGLITQDPHARDAVVTAVLKTVPLSLHGKRQLHSLLRSVSGSAGALGLIGIAGLIWSASGVMAAIRTALNVAWDAAHKRPFVLGKIVDLALVAGIFAVTGAAFGITVLASIARGGVRLPGALAALQPAAGAAAYTGVYLAAAALLFVTFMFLYRFVPAVPTRLRGVWPGALAATAGFGAVQYGFSLYIAYFSHYNKIYGSLGAVAAFLFFVYLASSAFLFGAEVAAEYPRLPAAAGLNRSAARRERRPRPANPPMVQTGGMPDLLARHRAVMPEWMTLYYDQPLELVSGRGNRVTDREGRSYLDFFGGILTNMIGYDVPEVREAVQRQLGTGIVHTSTLYLIRNQVELAEKIAKLSGITGAKVFFVNSGTEANETALMIAACARRSDQMLAMRGSYHGRSFGAVAITGIRSWKNASLSPFNVHYLHGTDRHLPAFAAMSDGEYIAACTEDLRHLLATATAGDVACMIAEPVQGVGGFTMPPDGLFAAYREVLDEHGILLISDEVQTGWGRTGDHFWGIGNHGVTPDIITFAKGLGDGLAIGGVVARGELLDGLPANGISTFGGNPLATAAANATLDYVLAHDLQANARTLGRLIIDGLRADTERLELAGQVRGRGLMFAVDVLDPATGSPSPALAGRVMEEARARGLLIGKGGVHGNTLRMAPPLTLTEAEAKEGLGIVVDSLRAVADGG